MKKKPNKYSKIDSKLKTNISSTASLPRAQQNTNFMLKNKAKIQSQSNINSNVCRKEKVSTKRKAAIPTRSEMKSIPKKEADTEQKDYVSMNRAKTKQIGGKIKENEQERFVKKKDYGQVPEYIIKRKLEKEELEQKKME